MNLDKKVLAKVNENKLTLKDIFTRKKFWWKPHKEGYIPLTFYTNWRHWTKEYNYLPTPDKFIEIQNKTFEELETKDKQEYFIIRNQNNVLTIILQNPNSYDFLNPYNVFFFGKNTKAVKPSLYWITSVDYINDRTLFAQITCEKDLFWYYYGSFCKSPGQARISSSQLGNDHTCKTPLLPVGGVIAGAMANKDCVACEWCYDFCGDLRVKKAKPGVKAPKPNGEEPAIAPWQPKYGIAYIDPNEMLGGNTTFEIPEREGGIIKIPDGLKLYVWNGDKPLRELPFLLFLVDDCQIKTANQKGQVNSFGRKSYLDLEYYLPNIYNEQPHLLNHSSAQFYFQKKLLFTANLKHLKVERKNNNFSLIFDLRIKSSISGILYYFQSGEIYYKWELKVQGAVSRNSLVRAAAGFFSKLWGGVKGAAVGVASGAVAGSVVPGAGTAAGAVAGGGTGAIKGWSDADKETKAKAKLPPPPDSFFKQFGLGLVGVKESPKTEQQTERLKKSTAKAIAKVVEPSIFYANTIDFSYDFWSFANRCIENPFEFRFEHSDLLLNQLHNNNNATPLLPFDCRFSQFQQLIKVGKWQGEVDLMFDYGGFWKEVLSRGTYFYNKPEEEFKPWQPKFKLTQSYTFKAISNLTTSMGEEEFYEEDDEEVVEVNRPKGSNFHQRGHYFIEYEDGSKDHWMALYPPFKNEELADGHTHGAFILEFDKPVKRFTDIYTCIGCGAQDTSLFEALHSNYRENPGGSNPSDSWDTIHKGLPFEPWFTEMGRARSPDYNLTVNGVAGRLGSKGDVWEKSVQEKSEGKPFSQAYGFVPNDSTITWKLGGKTLNVRYKEEKVQLDEEEKYQQQEFVEPEWTDDNTQFNSLIGEVDPDKAEREPLEEEREQDQEWDKPEKELKETSGEAEQEWEKEKEREAEREKEAEKERELEREAEREREREQEKELELEREKQRERETQTEREKKQRDQQWEKEKKDQERKEREARVREKEKARKEQRQKDKEKREKEKERE